jgi:hypothetical protein
LPTWPIFWILLLRGSIFPSFFICIFAESRCAWYSCPFVMQI